MIDVSICVVTNRDKFKEWCTFQIFKQCKFLVKKCIKFNINILTTRELMPYYKEQFSDWPILVLEQDPSEKNMGIHRNYLKSFAKGIYTTFLDDDDFYPDYSIYFKYIQLNFNKKYKKIDIIVTDEPLCYDLNKDETFFKQTACESGIFFRTSLKKNFGTSKNSGEGAAFISASKILVINDPELLIAITHDSNTIERTLENQKIGLTSFLCKGLPDKLILDPIEEELLKKLKN